MSDWDKATYDERVHYATCMRCNCSVGRAGVIAHMERQKAQGPPIVRDQVQQYVEQVYTQQQYAQANYYAERQYQQLQAEILAAGCPCAQCVEARRLAEANAEAAAINARAIERESHNAQTAQSALDWILNAIGGGRYPQPERTPEPEREDESRDLVPV